MGKLYKLRKAIRKDPIKWTFTYSGGGHARGAVFNEHESWYRRNNVGWQPTGFLFDNPKSYRSFVQSVLNEMKGEGVRIIR